MPKAPPPRPSKPQNLDQALTVPIVERAQLTNRHNAEWLRPEAWPEVARVAEAICDAARLPAPRLGRFHKDAGVRAVIELFAAGYTPDELVELAPAIAKHEWWSSTRSLAAVTLDVVREAAAPPAERLQNGRAPRMGEPGWTRQPNAGAVDHNDFLSPEVSNG